MKHWVIFQLAMLVYWRVKVLNHISKIAHWNLQKSLKTWVYRPFFFSLKLKKFPFFLDPQALMFFFTDVKSMFPPKKTSKIRYRSSPPPRNSRPYLTVSGPL